MDAAIDRAQLAAPLAVDQGESSWLCAELTGRGRHFAVLAWLHRTGPRFNQLSSGIGTLDHNQLPAAVRDIVPAWLPIVTPVRVETDDRPLLMVVLYDLDHPNAAPLQIEQEVEHAHFDASSFSGATHEIALRVLSDHIVIEAHTTAFALRLEARATKPAVWFGDGSPLLRHGDIEIGYAQRPRLALTGAIELPGERIDVTGAGAHDRHWRRSTVTNLAWLWLHLRLDAEREVNCYVLRDATMGAVIARRGWLIDARASVHALAGIDLASDGDGYVLRAPALDLRMRFVHAIEQPYVRMRAFGDAIDGGITEGPIRIVDPVSSRIEGWLEVFDARKCRPR